VARGVATGVAEADIRKSEALVRTTSETGHQLVPVTAEAPEV
jgi:hypothetical protein